MASTINATTNGIVNIGDSVATLALQTGGTTAVAIDTAQIVSLSKSLALLGSTSGSVALAAPAVAGTQSYTLPTAQPTASGQALVATTAGVMSWATASATPGGSSNQFQYNSGGSSFGGASNFTYNANGPITTSLGVGSTTPSASGAGIAFPATQSASTDANTLDDYEEGTWTPTFSFSGGSTGVTYSTQSGVYTKVGGLVNAYCYLILTSKGSSTGYVQIGGLPFSIVNVSNAYASSAVFATSMSSIVGAYTSWVAPNTSTIRVLFTGTGTTTSVTDTNCTNTSEFMINVTYRTT